METSTRRNGSGVALSTLDEKCVRLIKPHPEKMREYDLKKTLSIYNVKMHVLSQGDRFDLLAREPRLMKGRAAERLPEKEEEDEAATAA